MKKITILLQDPMKNIHSAYINTHITKYNFPFVYKIGITAGLTSIREVAALLSPTIDINRTPH